MGRRPAGARLHRRPTLRRSCPPPKIRWTVQPVGP